MKLENLHQAKEIFKALIAGQQDVLELFNKAVATQQEVNNSFKENESLLFATLEKMGAAIAELDKRLSKLEQDATT